MAYLFYKEIMKKMSYVCVYIHLSLCVYVCVACIYVMVCGMEARGEPCGTGSFLPPLHWI